MCFGEGFKYLHYVKELEIIPFPANDPNYGNNNKQKKECSRVLFASMFCHLKFAKSIIIRNKVSLPTAKMLYQIC